MMVFIDCGHLQKRQANVMITVTGQNEQNNVPCSPFSTGLQYLHKHTLRIPSRSHSACG